MLLVDNNDKTCQIKKIDSAFTDFTLWIVSLPPLPGGMQHQLREAALMYLRGFESKPFWNSNFRVKVGQSTASFRASDSGIFLGEHDHPATQDEGVELFGEPKQSDCRPNDITCCIREITILSPYHQYTLTGYFDVAS